MTDRHEPRSNCTEFGDDLVEFALGTLSGRRRSVLLEHLEGCPQCRAELDSMATVTDTLLWLAPEADPPVGFEMRVVEKFAPFGARRAQARRRRVVVLAVAATLVAILGFGVGAVSNLARSGGQPTALARPTTARLMSSGQVMGQVSISAGTPSWLIMTVDDGSWSGTVWCEVTFANGRTVDVGRFNLMRGYGSWISRVTTGGSRVRTAKLVTGSGQVVASATLSA